ncbi:AMP-binding protein [Alphaproteobacteria bacterium]|nr:AMP-binding protein [Alphaproteobacteria bacterium]
MFFTLTEIERQVQFRPDKAALITADRSVTYAQLWQWTDEVARQLVQNNLDSSKPAAYFGSNGIGLIVAFIATQKLGLAFFPINLKYPKPIIEDVCTRADVSLVITDQAPAPENGQTSVWTMPSMPAAVSGSSWLEIEAFPEERVSLLQCSSGSTGKPKIIPYTRKMEEDYTQIHLDEYRLTSSDIVVHTGNFWMESVLATLMAGATVTCIDTTAEGMGQIIDRLADDKATVLLGYLALFKLFDNAGRRLPDLRLVGLSGEAVSHHEVAIFNNLTQKGSVLLNAYAAMEATWLTSYRYCNGEPFSALTMPAGPAVEPHHLSLVTESGDLVAPGEIGEIIVTSPLLPDSYVNGDAKENQKYGVNDQGKKTYATGDLGYFDSAGDLHYMGRKDDQVRINGFNVRLSLIETEIKRHSNVSECAVIAEQDERRISRLFAFYVGSASDQDIREFLSEGLPQYMIPKVLSKVAELPKTVTGKIQRNQLAETDTTQVTPTDEQLSATEQQLSEIWQRVLSWQDFGAHDNFFDAGGDSLSSMDMLLDVEQLCQKRISLDSFVISGATIASLADLLEGNNHDRVKVLKPGKARSTIHMTHVYDGGVSDYLDLAAAFDRDVRVVGITADYFSRSRAMLIEAKAEEAVKHLPKEDERVLVGFSYAGLVALEIARLTPETRTSLVLIDPYSKFFRSPKLLHYAAALIKGRLQRPKTLGFEEDYPGDRLYNPQPIELEKVALFHGNEFPDALLPRWQKLFRGHVDFFRQPGDHLSMMHSGSAIQMAGSISRWLET